MLDRRTLLKSIPFLSVVPWGKALVPAKPVEAKEPDVLESLIGCEFTVILDFRFPRGRMISRPVTATIFHETAESLRYRGFIPADQQADIIGSTLKLVTINIFGSSQQCPPVYNTRPDGASDILIDGWLRRTMMQKEST